MKSWRGLLVLLPCFLFSGLFDTRAQGVYFINTSWATVDVAIDVWTDVGQIAYPATLAPGDYLYLDGNVFYSDVPEGAYYTYSWQTINPLYTTEPATVGGVLDWPDILAHYQNFGPVIWVPVTRGGEELAVGRAVITNSSLNTYQFQGQTIDPGATVAFLTPNNSTMWNTRWGEVQRFGTLVTQPIELQYNENRAFRNLDWQEAMMWWGGHADPVQWAWYDWDGQTFTHQGNELQGMVPGGSGVATPPANPVTPNWPQVLTGNNDPPSTFTPGGTAPNTPAGGGGTGGGGNGGGNGGGTGGGNGNGGGNGGGGNGGGGGSPWATIGDDYAREPTLQQVQEDTAKIRQHTWGANQRLDEIADLLTKPDEGATQEAIDQVTSDFNDGVAELSGDFSEAAGTSFYDLLLNNLPADGQGAVYVDGLGFNNMEISPRMEPWGDFLPWCKGVILIACTIAVFYHIWETFRDTAHRVALTQGQNGNGVAGAGFDADNVFALANYGISMTALLAFLGVCAVVVSGFMGSALYGEVSQFISNGLSGNNSNAQYVAILADWTYAVIPVHGMIGLLAAKAAASLAIFGAGMAGHAGMKAALS